MILVHAAEGSSGFPREETNDDLLEPVKPFVLGGIEEERRLFYVALTRSEQTVDFLTRADDESRFLDEISNYTETVDAGKVEPLDEVGERMNVTVQVDDLGDLWTKQHQRGLLNDRYGGSARFVSWKNGAPPTLDKGTWYRLADVRVGEYKGEKELVLTEKCSVTPLPDGPDDTEIVQLQ